jgi:hypothetical protein
MTARQRHSRRAIAVHEAGATFGEIVMWSIVAAYFAFLVAIICWPSK